MSAHRSFRYMSRFRCIGPACEASCCADWSIEVDKAHYHKLKSAMDGSAADRARFRDAHQRVRGPEGQPARYALLVLKEDRGCSMLESDGNCLVHRRFGESHLSDTCATYPRKISIARGHAELAGLISCPEVARQLLLHDDALAIDPLDIGTLRDFVTQNVGQESSDPYAEYLDDVRATVATLLELPGYPLSSRLFFVGWFAEQTRGAFRRGASPEAHDVLAAAIARVGDPEALEAWHRTVASHAVTTPRAGWVVVSALKERVERRLAYDPFRDLVRECFSNVGAPANGDDLSVEPTAMFAAYCARRDARDGDAIDAMFTRYAVDYWLKEFYTNSTDLATHGHKLVLRIAILRYLLFSHPGYDTAGPEATLVEVVYKFARAVEHDALFAKSLDALLVSLELTSLAHAVFLMKM